MILTYWEHKVDFSEEKFKKLCTVNVTTGWCNCLLILPLGHSLHSGSCFGAFFEFVLNFWLMLFV